MTVIRAGETGSGFEKSALAFRTISEVADDLDVAQHVLRYWESRFSQIRPLKRGGGRRYYRPEDVDLLRRIRCLLYDEGHTIKGVQRLLKEGRGRLSIAAEIPSAQPATDVALPSPTTRLDSAKRREIANTLVDLQDALDLLRGALRK